MESQIPQDRSAARRADTALTVGEAFRVLGLAPGADRETVRLVYRRLAFANHPDRNAGSAESFARFKRVTAAYKLLCDKFSLDGGVEDAGECEKCGRYGVLLEGMDGSRCCRDCLTLLWGRRPLPAPTIVIASCGVAIVALVVATTALVMLMATQEPWYGVASLVACLVTLVSLVTTCVTVVFVAGPGARRRG